MSRPRSLLITPAHRAEMLAKALSYGADALILDLEDSVPVSEKAKARSIAREFIGRYRRRIAVYAKVNSLQSGLLADDLDALVVPGLAGIKLPKAESAEQIRTVDALLAERERAHGLPRGAIGIGPTIESAKGLWFAYEIASASLRIESVMPGTAQDADLQCDLGYACTPGDGGMLQYIRAHVLLAARAAGVAHPIDGAYANFRDLEGLRASCEAARRLGYRAKQVIHPAQIETVNRVFDAAERGDVRGGTGAR